MSLHLIPLLDFDEVNRTGGNYEVFSWQVKPQPKWNGMAVLAVPSTFLVPLLQDILKLEQFTNLDTEQVLHNLKRNCFTLKSMN